MIILQFYKFYINPCRMFDFTELVKGINITTTNRKEIIMQRTYRERKYICGDFVEVAIFPVYTQTRGRSKRKKPTTEIQQRLNRRHATDRFSKFIITTDDPSSQIVTVGDANDDGKINLDDVVVLAQYVAEWDIECNEAALDTNGDGTVNLDDIVHLAQYVAEREGIVLG